MPAWRGPVGGDFNGRCGGDEGAVVSAGTTPGFPLYLYEPGGDGQHHYWMSLRMLARIFRAQPVQTHWRCDCCGAENVTPWRAWGAVTTKGSAV